MTTDDLPFDIGNKIGPDPEESGYDAGGWLKGGYRISAATLHPVPQLTPEQVAAYTRVIELARRWQERDAD